MYPAQPFRLGGFLVYCKLEFSGESPLTIRD